MFEMEPKDVELLRYIEANPGFDNAIMSKEFSFYTHARLEKLMLNRYVTDNRSVMPQDDKSRYLGLYLITEEGLAFLEDYRISLKTKKKEFYRNSIITPILVTVATTIVISLVQWLLSQIL